MAASAHYTIADFKHRIAICSMQDVVEENGVMSLVRKDVYHAWAKIIPMAQSLFNRDGDSVKQSREVRTHKIVIRFRRDIDFTVAAWIYEERLQSGSRWFKMISAVDQGEVGRYFEMDCRLVERGSNLNTPVDPVAKPSESIAIPLPQGVRL